ncbi:MAG: serine hydroxymethyltransferase [Alphaproteobacteria bacterium]|jgi:glycine hydroxymethyltransferase|nr:serine hydroxymethyltransferase [Alphaproteobacteria bacterium]
MTQVSNDNQPMEIEGLIAAYETAQAGAINLVASENRMSCNALKAVASDLIHRYVIPPSGERPATIWDYPNQEIPREIVGAAQDLACSVYGAMHANVFPLSGNQIPSIILGSLRAGDTFFSVGADCGGHFTTAVVSENVRLHRFDLPYDLTTGQIDIDRTADLAKSERPKLVFLDASMMLFPYPLEELRAAVGKDVIISYDASHTLGIIAGGQFQDPLAEGADLLHGSTHKSLPGPQHGIIMDKMDAARAQPIYERILPLSVSNAHLHHIAALGITLREMRDYGQDYARAVVDNARSLGRALNDQGLRVAFAGSGYTDSHQTWGIVGDKSAAMRAFRDLETAGIRTNAVHVPFTSEYGLRLGTPEMTRRGMGREAIDRLAPLFADAVLGRRDTEVIRKDVADLSRAYPGLYYTDDAPKPEVGAVT